MKNIALMLGIILVGIFLLNPSKRNYNIQNGIEEESYGDMIGQETLKHL